MADPKIRFDIEAGTSGDADVNRLATSLERLDGAIDPALAENAKRLAEELRNVGAQQAAIDRFVQLKQRSNETAAALQAAQAAAQAMARELAASDAPTRGQVGRLEKLRDTVRAAKTAHTEATQALQAQRGALQAVGVETGKLQAHQADLTRQSAELAQAAQRVGQRYNEQAKAAEKAATRQVASSKPVLTGLQGIGAQLRTLQQLAGAAIGGQLLGGLVGQVAETADSYTNLASRIRLATGEGAAFDAAFESIFDIATRTNSSLESTGTLFTRLADAGKNAGLTSVAATQQALSLTETINQAIQVSGGSAQSSEAALTQLIQGLQSGILRGEEFNSVMEQAPRLARALADGLGVTTGELRKQAEQGRLTADVVIGALQGQAAVVAGEFSQLAPTVGRAIQNLSTEWTRYVGEVDKANGISAAAARAINALASNLDTLGAVLYAAGKAAIAYQAIKLAQTFATIAIEAKAAGVSIGAAAAATAAAGGVGSAAAAGFAKLVGVLRTLRSLTLVGLLVNAPDIGKWLGEGIAKLQGYGKALADAEARAKAEAEATRLAAIEKAAYVQRLKQAEEASLGLNKQSRALIAEFEGIVAKGDSVQAALEKIAKSLTLGSVEGITDAVTALDALEQKGKITGDQIAQALSTALSGRDLAIFETQAKTAFDNSEQGARRLAQALDGITTEALRRAGTSAAEIGTGFSAASTSALNDVDKLVEGLERLGAKGEAAGLAIERSLDQALQAAKTEQAVQAVIQRYEELGKQGLLTGDRLAEGLDKARRKLEEIVPGVNTVAEAFRTLGLTAPAELRRIADGARSAFDVIKNDGNLSLLQKQEAFRRMADAVIASGDQIKIAQLGLEASFYGLELAVDATGKAMLRNAGASETLAGGMNRVRVGVDSVTGALDSQSAALDRQTAAQERANEVAQRAIDLDNKRRNVDANGFSKDKTGTNTINAAGNTLLSLINELKAYGLEQKQAQDLAREFTDAKGDVPYFNNPGQAKYGGSTLSQALSRAAQKALFGADGSGATLSAPTTPAPAAPASVAAPAASSTQTLVIKFGTSTASAQFSSPQDVASAKTLVQQLATEAARAAR